MYQSFLETKQHFVQQLSNKSLTVYWCILSLMAVVLITLPFIYTTISIKATGIIRPTLERTEVKTIISGNIDSLYYREGDTVVKDGVIVRLKNNNEESRKLTLRFDIAQHQAFIADLDLLTSMGYLSSATISNLHSPLYKQQISRFLYQQAEQENGLRKAAHELDVNRQLANDSIITSKELFDKQIENQRLQAAYSAFKTEQLAAWQQELARNNSELAQLMAQKKQQEEEMRLYEVRAPVSGIVQNINSRYTGGAVNAGEALCVISPEADLLAECYLSTRDAGLIKQGQEVNFQVDAFDYNYFGILTGKVKSIDNDFTVIDNKPVFKVYCLFNAAQLNLKNGYSGKLKKGLTFQSRFIVARRSLWQLLWDKLDDWLNPSSPST